MVLNQESYQSDTSDVPPSCIYTGYTSQHGKSILYRDNICFVNEQHTQIVCVDRIWTCRRPGVLDNGPNSEISFSESGDGDSVRYKSTAVLVDHPPKTESTVYAYVCTAVPVD